MSQMCQKDVKCEKVKTAGSKLALHSEILHNEMDFDVTKGDQNWSLILGSRDYFYPILPFSKKNSNRLIPCSVI